MRAPVLSLSLAVVVVSALPGQTKPVLGRSSFNGLRARVTAVRFFESAGNIPDPKSRVLATSFDALTTRFINLELELEYPAAVKRTPIAVDCRFDGPGGVSKPLRLAGTVDQGWTGSYHAGGVGSVERGQWAEGTYQVRCVEGGQQVLATQIEVVKSIAAVGKLGAAVVQMKFYQSQAERLPIEPRRYSTRFDTRTARWIKTEFALVYPQVAAPVSFIVECAYVFPDKSVQRVSVERQVPAGWTGSVHTQGIAPERWPVGKYTVSCWNNGEKMAERSFEVFDSGVAPPRDAVGGRLQFFARKSGDPAGAPVYDDSFALGSYDSLYVEASVPQRLAADSAAFGCVVTDPAGLTSGFPLKGELRERALVATGPVGSLDAPALRGGYRVECRTGSRGVVADRFTVTGPPDLATPDLHLTGKALFAGDDDPPGDEAVPDVVFSVAKLKTLWVVVLLDHPTEQAGRLTWACKLTGARNTVVAVGESQTTSVGAGDRSVVLRQRLVPPARQRWTAGKLTLSCASGNTTFIRETVDLTR